LHQPDAASPDARANSEKCNEVLAEKIPYRVGFCVGFLAERGSNATETYCPYGG
jgi:hypothetical protein